MSQLHIPMKRFGTTVRLAHGGGFDVRNCPDPEVLAFTIERACNSHAQLVAALRETLDQTAAWIDEARGCKPEDLMDNGWYYRAKAALESAGAA